MQDTLLNVQNLINNPDAAYSLLNNPAAQSLAVQTFEEVYNNLLPLMQKGLANISFTINGKSFTFKLNTIKTVITSSSPSYTQVNKLGATSDTLDLRPKLQPIRNQGNVECCVAFSSACMKEYESGVPYYLSPSFIYHLRDDPQHQDCMTIPNALDILIKYGTCYESTYPQADIQSALAIPTDAYNEAVYFKIYSYVQIELMDDLKDALNQFGPCLIAFPVYNYSNQLWIQKTGDKFKGGHCMTVVGYDTSNFIIRNTWGTSWGDNGYTYYPFSQWGSHWEVWTCTQYGSLPPPPPKFASPTTKPNNQYGLPLILYQNIIITNSIQIPIYMLIIGFVILLLFIIIIRLIFKKSPVIPSIEVDG